MAFSCRTETQCDNSLTIWASLFTFPGGGRENARCLPVRHGNSVGIHSITYRKTDSIKVNSTN